ncbi:MAG: EAL domain-containing protein [Rhodocyclales bacterium]|nr:EAL domain-containing protein [Rhodocyclales bacterium]
MSIRARLALAFALLLCLALTVAVVTLGRLDDLTAKSRELVDHQARRVLLAQQVNQHAQAAAIGLLKLLQTSRREDRVPLYAAMDADLAASDRAVRELGDGLLGADERPAMSRVADIRQRYGEQFQATVEMIEIDGVAPARDYFAARTGKLLNTLLFEIEALEAVIQKRMQDELEALRVATGEARRIVLLLAGAALALGALLAWAIGRGIVTPLREAVALAGAIAGGDYRAAVPCCRKDEFGELLRSLDSMRDSIASREERLARIAYVDQLTGLPNRARLMERLAALPPRAPYALAILDIQRFALINHALGHAVGDRLLSELGARLQRDLDAEEAVARLWGDKFAVLFTAADRVAAQARLDALLAGLRQPLSIDGQRLDVDASVGVALRPGDAADAASLMRRAHLALEAAKRCQCGYAFAADIAAEPQPEQLSLIGEMREALSGNQFELHYQPKLDLAGHRVAGAEALIRWRHPRLGMVPPGRFVPFAERTGFIREITPWALRRAVADAAGWQDAGLDIVVAVNLSARDLLNRDLVSDVARLLAQSRLAPRRLCLEITESALMDDPELALSHLHELAALGLKLSIDDYGTGQASLAYVKILPVHELKIDRAFVAGVDSTPRNAAIVRSTLLLCRELGLTVVAEGAETPGEIDWLRANACDLVQGYGVARPMPAPDFRAWVEAHAAATAVVA